jgi:hypothetical protein
MQTTVALRKRCQPDGGCPLILTFSPDGGRRNPNALPGLKNENKRLFARPAFCKISFRANPQDLQIWEKLQDAHGVEKGMVGGFAELIGGLGRRWRQARRLSYGKRGLLSGYTRS